MGFHRNYNVPGVQYNPKQDLQFLYDMIMKLEERIKINSDLILETLRILKKYVEEVNGD